MIERNKKYPAFSATHEYIDINLPRLSNTNLQTINENTMNPATFKPHQYYQVIK